MLGLLIKECIKHPTGALFLGAVIVGGLMSRGEGISFPATKKYSERS